MTTQLIMHRRLLTSEAKRWFCEDVGIPLIACTATAALLYERITWSGTRLSAALDRGSSSRYLSEASHVMVTPLTRKQIRELIGPQARQSRPYRLKQGDPQWSRYRL